MKVGIRKSEWAYANVSANRERLSVLHLSYKTSPNYDSEYSQQYKLILSTKEDKEPSIVDEKLVNDINVLRNIIISIDKKTNKITSIQLYIPKQTD